MDLKRVNTQALRSWET